jgi:hypothetical protein
LEAIFSLHSFSISRKVPSKKKHKRREKIEEQKPPHEMAHSLLMTSETMCYTERERSVRKMLTWTTVDEEAFLARRHTHDR